MASSKCQALKRIKEMVVKKGGENVTVLSTVIGGEATNQLVFLASSENSSKYGQVQEAFYGDPKAQAKLLEAGKLATCQTYAAQTLDSERAARNLSGAGGVAGCPPRSASNSPAPERSER